MVQTGDIVCCRFAKSDRDTVEKAKVDGINGKVAHLTWYDGSRGWLPLTFLEVVSHG